MLASSSAMGASRLSSGRCCAIQSNAIALVLLVLSVLASHQVLGQVLDGDEQFQAYHQDIGRISGANGAQVAPQTTIVERPAAPVAELQAPPALLVPTSPLPAIAARGHSGNAQHQHHHHHHHQPSATSSRKPNRITLVARRDPLASAALVAAVGAPSLAAPAPAPVALDNDEGHNDDDNRGAHHHHTTLLEPTTSAAAAPPVLQQQQQRSAASFSGPALASFRGSAAASAAVAAPVHHHHAHLSPPPVSVSARHSALMAQVAAERAASPATPVVALGGIVDQPSLGAPIGALSSPPVAAVAPPPQAVHAPLHHQPQASVPVFASHHAGAAPQHQHHQHQHHAQPAIENPTFISAPQAEEPQVAPSFEQVLGGGCPHKGVWSWENKDHCDRYYMCTNGTFTEEACPNGLAYSQMGAVYQHCAYNWNVDCGRKKTAEPIASPGCPWQFGIFPILQNGRCSIDYYACEWGVPEPKRCSPEGLFYDDRIKGCQWADQLGCKSEALLNFKCPAEDEDNPYWPYPRYYHNTQDVIVCVNEQPRLVHCNEDQLVDPSSLACIDVKKSKKKF